MAEGDTLILTPTARLARAEARRAAIAERDRGREAWLRPRILTFPAWLAELRDHWFLAGDDERVPIGSIQAEALWQSVIDREVFIGEPRVAQLAQRAWRLIHEHALEAPAQWPDALLSEDSRRFRDWAGRFQAHCARHGLVDEWTFASELPGLIAAGRMPVPKAVELAGFDMPLTPLQERILEALAQAGAEIRKGDREQRREPAAGELSEVLAFVVPEAELLAAARWARARLEGEPDQSIAVVVPDLEGRVDQAERVFRRVFDPPGFGLAESGKEAWHLSLGRPLAQWPLAADALAVLRLSDFELTQPEAGHLLRSPFLDGWGTESAARSRGLARLARRAPYRLTFPELRYCLEKAGADILARRMEEWRTLRREQTGGAWPSAWAARFQQELSALGFGQGRVLDSREYQVLARWHELLEEISALDVVTARPLSRARALSLLAERAGATVFRERNPGVPVEVLGVDEALGSRFDAAWIAALDGETWPRPARRDPLIPGPVQQTVPRSTGPGCLEQARRELRSLLACAPELRGSFATGSGEEPRLRTALLADCLDRPAPPEPEPRRPEMDPPFEDAMAPALEEASEGGGTGVLRNQSDCPFKAFAANRLGADDLTPPRPGLDAMARGKLVHRALEHFWTGLPGSAALKELEPAALEERIAAAAGRSLDDFTGRNRKVLSPAGRDLEQACLVRTLSRWLEIERQRGDFTVIALEQKIPLRFAGLELTGKIDRIDELDAGGTVLIDYKTGKSGKAGWFPEPRMADPQLPAYAVAMDPRPSALAFARIRPDELGFDGLSAADAGIPGVIELARARGKFSDNQSWSGLLDEWGAHLEALATDFRAGRARVHPRQPVQTCRYCHLHALCRIHERRPPADDTAPESAEVADD